MFLPITSRASVAQAFNPVAEAEGPPTEPSAPEAEAPEAPKLEPADVPKPEPADAPKPEPMDVLKPDPVDEPKPEPADAEAAPAEAPQPLEASTRVVVLSSVRPGKLLLLCVLMHASALHSAKDFVW